MRFEERVPVWELPISKRLQELVVIAIIAILAAMLMPALQQARGRARQANCVSNLKQYGVVIAQYAQAYDDYFIPQNGLRRFNSTSTTDWYTWESPVREMLAPGIIDTKWKKGQSVNGCPEASDSANAVVDGTKQNVIDRYYSYAICSSVMGTIAGPRKITQLKTPTRCASFAEGTTYNISQSAYHNARSDGKPARLELRHQDGNAGNFCFADGHVETLVGAGWLYANKMPAKGLFSPGQFPVNRPPY